MLASIALALLPLLAYAAPAPLAKRATNQLIYAGRDNLCLSLETGSQGNNGASNLSNGLAVVSKPCDQATVWDINSGSGSIFVSNSDSAYALDAGENPGNFGSLKIWQSYPGLYQQTWYYTDDKRIAITGGDQCLDEGDNGVQLYQCTTGNTNQIWNTVVPTPRNDPQPL
ncbi:hypothetical protein CI109_100717 [Kwoniella shandongensis]|uniref:Uncharacterized protein n=1 Tax=Kwoniella shandongensis TaxID=1734106 RepID=A0A5M6BZ61_9TREE|nr:uncharacterized protein CI109_003362 [Kwoniella shandongensis]KAA5528074.1 hypothetical protein CI109_003362 [Kwoniella shandongensis]